MDLNPQTQGNPFPSRSRHLSEGAVTIEQSRAVAEAQGKIAIAKSFPRDEAEAYNAIKDSCSRKALAEQAFYEFPRGNETVKGLSIRMAEELARVWGNIDYGLRELSNKPGETEMEAYCWDMQTNVYSSQKFTVKHERHTRSGVRALTDPRDIYEMSANLGARRLRARILAVLPPDLIDQAAEWCKETLRSGIVDVQDTANKVIAAFSQHSVTESLILQRYNIQSRSQINSDMALELRGIFIALKDGIAKPSDYFNLPEAAPVGAAAHALNTQLLPSDDDRVID